MTSTNDGLHLQLRISLREVEPEIWRRVVVPAAVGLDQLHEVLQIAMGWTNSHLYQFEIGDDVYVDLDADDDPDEDDLDAAEYAVGEVAEVGDRFTYLYDFGDCWEHEVVVEATTTEDAGAGSAHCLDGRRAGPPEDCGGPSGYADLLLVLGDPDHEDHEELTAWLGQPFDPEALDLGAINAQLARLPR